MSQSNYVVDTLISAKSIAARIEDLAKEIELEFKETDKLIVVGLLRGSFVFIADLVREINLPVEVDFLEASSYGDGMVSSKEVRILGSRLSLLFAKKGINVFFYTTSLNKKISNLHSYNLSLIDKLSKFDNVKFIEL